MSYRTLAWIPVALAVLLLVTEVLLGAGAEPLVRGEVEVAKVVWLVGALAAARGFERGDYLRRGWLLIAAGVALFLVRDATLLASGPLALLRGLLVVAGNVLQVWGVLVLARVWSAAGLDDAVRGQRRVLFGAAIVAAAVLTGPSIAHDLGSVLTGQLEALPHLASDLGDAAGFVLLAALVRTALALRGGVVFWVWSLLATGQLAWVLFDGARTITEVIGASSSSPWVECLRVVGASYFCAAGLAQRWVVSARFPVDMEDAQGAAH
jgi:hypothetical protein